MIAARRWAGALVALLLTIAGLATSVSDVAAATSRIDVFDSFIVEDGSGATTIAVTVEVSPRPTATVTVNYTTSDGTATSPADYTAVSGTLEVASGKKNASVLIPIVNDNTVENDEQFNFTISNPVGATLGDASAVVRIVDDDRANRPRRVCDDGNPYTTDSYLLSADRCNFVVRTGADDDADKVVAAWVGGPDCDDHNALVNHKQAEVLGDGIDNNCDGLIDSSTVRNCSDGNPYTSDRYASKTGRCSHTLITNADFDGDGYIGAWVGGTDCNDSNASIYPGAPESVLGVDSNCDGFVKTTAPVATVTTVPVGKPSDCPAGASCEALTVQCNNLPIARAYIATTMPTVTPRGVITMFVGTEGAGFYDSENKFVPRLTSNGFILARVSWPDGWNNSYPDGPYGLTTAACRGAAIIQYIHDKTYVPLGLSPQVGACGFCVTGNSNGATLTAYALAEYGLESIIDAAVVSSGPLPTKIADACLEPPDGSTYGFHRPTLVDMAYGFVQNASGPCTLQDPSMETIWRADSLAESSTDDVYPNTRVSILIGGLDDTTAPNHAAAWRDRIIAAGSPIVFYRVVPTAGHGLSTWLADTAAQDALVEEFTYQPSAS